jgi:hypothetical protein
MTSEADSRPTDPRQRTPWLRPASRIRPSSALGDRLVLECARFARQRVPFALIAVHHVLWRDEGPESREALRDHVRRHVSDNLRVSDSVYGAGLPGCHVVVLPHTGARSADTVLRRLEECAEAASTEDLGPVSVESVDRGGPTATAADILKRIDAHFRERAGRHLEGDTSERPAARVPVGDLDRLEEALHTEINLAGRDGTSLSVVALHAPADDDAVPGLLACDIDAIAARTIRGCDQVFEVGPTCTAFILSRTEPEKAGGVGERVVKELLLQDPDAPYGAPSVAVLEFGCDHKDAAALLDALRRLVR